MKEKRASIRSLFPPLLLAVVLGLGSQTPPPASDLQEPVPAKRPNTDYMGKFLSQSTKPLGVEVDKSLQRLLRQPLITWAARAARRHILN